MQEERTMELNMSDEMFAAINEYFQKVNCFDLNRKRAIQAGIKSPETEVVPGANVRIPNVRRQRN